MKIKKVIALILAALMVVSMFAGTLMAIFGAF